MSSTNRGYDRHKSDYYITPINQISLFLDRFMEIEEIDNSELQVLDPCAGGDTNNPMSYVEALRTFTEITNIDSIDIREDSRAITKSDYLLIDCKNKYDIMITNPPFNIAQEIIEKALDDVKNNGYVIMLLRLNYLGSKKRKLFWDNNMPKYVFVHHERMSFIKSGGTDSIEYAHFVWQKGNIKQTTLFII